MTSLKEQGGLTTASQVTPFLTELLKIIADLPSSLKKKTVSGMAHLIEDQDVAVVKAYFQAAKDLFLQVSGGKRSLSPSTGQPGLSLGASQGGLKMPSKGVIDLLTDENIDDLGHCSKRSKQMLRSIKPPSAPVGNNSVGPGRNTHVLASLKAMELPGALSLPKQRATSTTSTCSICQELSELYRAPGCGHVYCRPCWIRTTPRICPTCRASFTVGELARVDVVHNSVHA